jgi:hypothetical protein
VEAVDKTKFKATKLKPVILSRKFFRRVILKIKHPLRLEAGPANKRRLRYSTKLAFQALADGENIRIMLGSATKVAGINESTDVLTTRGAFGMVTITSNSVQPTATPTSLNTSTPTPTPIQGGEATPLTLQKPSDGSVVQTSTPTFQGTASPGSTVTIVIFSEPMRSGYC